MIEEILPNLYRMEIPLPQSPLKALNSYVIKAPGRNLLVDTGMNREECMAAMQAGLRDLGVDLRETDFFITHMHSDHSGLVSDLASDKSRIYCSRLDSVMIVPDINTAEGWYKNMVDFALLNGFPESVMREALRMHPGFRYSATGSLNFSIIREGDIISIGDYEFICVETPGHTWGHMCLYDRRRKMLVAGDHILADITPNISVWSDDRNSLGEYLESLDKVRDMEISLVLPGHRSLIKDCRGRIEELKAHHRKRSEEILSILGNGALDAYGAASQMSWDLTYESWELFPAPQKWFATGEALSHLKYLTEEGLIKKKTKGGKIVFSTLNS